MELRESLLSFYLQQRKEQQVPLSVDSTQYFWELALVRSLQVLGAYGFRGYLQGKEHFIESIPFALNNLSMILHRCSLIHKLPYLNKLLKHLTT